METKTENKVGPTRRKSTTRCEKLVAKEQRNASLKKVAQILQKSEDQRSVEENQFLTVYSDLVTDLKSRWQKRDELKKRMEEWEEPMEVLQDKALTLAKAIAQAEHLVIYTGAGISTAAKIPDYRGTNGIWTRLQQGKDIGNHDLSLAEPTYTHMVLSELYRKKILKYIVSQNCDGLHLRSGLPRTALSELHGNMYIEVCKSCKPAREYWRLFDVTENTARYSHKTYRRCYVCNNELTDTIVHFGERGTLQWPLNWKGACSNADKADTILCLGSSLKVLKRYPWLWQMNKPAKKRPKLFIVNLQWTPKDEHAQLKINGKCDVVMKLVMKYLGIEIPQYERKKDPIFFHATTLIEEEYHTTNQPFLKENLEEENDITDSKEEKAGNCITDYVKKVDVDSKEEKLKNDITDLKKQKLDVMELKEEKAGNCFTDLVKKEKEADIIDSVKKEDIDSNKEKLGNENLASIDPNEDKLRNDVTDLKKQKLDVIELKEEKAGNDISNLVKKENEGNNIIDRVIGDIVYPKDEKLGNEFTDLKKQKLDAMNYKEEKAGNDITDLVKKENEGNDIIDQVKKVDIDPKEEKLGNDINSLVKKENEETDCVKEENLEKPVTDFVKKEDYDNIENRLKVENLEDDILDPFKKEQLQTNITNKLINDKNSKENLKTDTSEKISDDSYKKIKNCENSSSKNEISNSNFSKSSAVSNSNFLEDNKSFENDCDTNLVDSKCKSKSENETSNLVPESDVSKTYEKCITKNSAVKQIYDSDSPKNNKIAKSDSSSEGNFNNSIKLKPDSNLVDLKHSDNSDLKCGGSDLTNAKSGDSPSSEVKLNVKSNDSISSNSKPMDIKTCDPKISSSSISSESSFDKDRTNLKSATSNDKPLDLNSIESEVTDTKRPEAILKPSEKSSVLKIDNLKSTSNESKHVETNPCDLKEGLRIVESEVTEKCDLVLKSSGSVSPKESYFPTPDENNPLDSNKSDTKLNTVVNQLQEIDTKVVDSKTIDSKVINSYEIDPTNDLNPTDLNFSTKNENFKGIDTKVVDSMEVDSKVINSELIKIDLNESVSATNQSLCSQNSQTKNDFESVSISTSSHKSSISLSKDTIVKDEIFIQIKNNANCIKPDEIGGKSLNPDENVKSQTVDKDEIKSIENDALRQNSCKNNRSIDESVKNQHVDDKDIEMKNIDDIAKNSCKDDIVDLSYKKDEPFDLVLDKTKGSTKNLEKDAKISLANKINRHVESVHYQTKAIDYSKNYSYSNNINISKNCDIINLNTHHNNVKISRLTYSSENPTLTINTDDIIEKRKTAPTTNNVNNIFSIDNILSPTQQTPEAKIQNDISQNKIPDLKEHKIQNLTSQNELSMGKRPKYTLESLKRDPKPPERRHTEKSLSKTQPLSIPRNQSLEQLENRKIQNLVQNHEKQRSVQLEIQKPQNQSLELETQKIQNLMLMQYYANTMLQNQMLGYMNSNFYPFQTSFMYSGLHSIINPIPFINYDFSQNLTTQTNQSIKIDKNAATQQTSEKRYKNGVKITENHQARHRNFLETPRKDEERLQNSRLGNFMETNRNYEGTLENSRPGNFLEIPRKDLSRQGNLLERRMEITRLGNFDHRVPGMGINFPNNQNGLPNLDGHFSREDLTSEGYSSFGPQVRTEVVPEVKPQGPPSCSYCYQNYESYSCLYYLKVESKFLNQLYRFSKIKNVNNPLFCICCDYTTEEEVMSSEENEDIEIINNKKLRKTKDVSESDSDSLKMLDNINDDSSNQSDVEKKDDKDPKAKVQPGWFGKGYRKNRKYIGVKNKSKNFT